MVVLRYTAVCGDGTETAAAFRTDCDDLSHEADKCAWKVLEARQSPHYVETTILSAFRARTSLRRSDTDP